MLAVNKISFLVNIELISMKFLWLYFFDSMKIETLFPLTKQYCCASVHYPLVGSGSSYNSKLQLYTISQSKEDIADILKLVIGVVKLFQFVM